ncbi:MAG: ATP-dependent helicase [Spartobacteria bacterium]|nr:ATP-dependent helicase [Spartobacteria bacterium]
MTKTIDFEKTLNAEQCAAATAADGPVLVIAAAGTGKTRTLTHRVAYLVEQGIDAQRILLLTFTNKAANEMVQRATTLVGERVGGLWGGTFHHMANRILRRQATRIGYQQDYSILDADDSKRLVRACVDELKLKSKHFPKPEVLMGLFGMAASTERQVVDLAHQRFQYHDISAEDIARVHALFMRRKRELNAMDFDDLLTNALQLFREHADVAEMYQQRFQYVLVDEYQDTNVIQSEWVDTLAKGYRNILVVGDDFQSIYSWRGADFRNIMSFPVRYPDARIFKLETNYRSVPEVLAVANACIAGNPEQYQKTLHARREPYKRPVLAELRDGGDQARFVIDTVRNLRREGYAPKDIAVLYRAHFHALELQMELARQGMPFFITSGSRFFEQAHIKDVCTVLRLLGNASDQLSFLRLMELIPKVGKRTAEKIWTAMEGAFDARQADKRQQLVKGLPNSARETGEQIMDVFAAYYDGRIGNTPGAVIEEFVNVFYDEYAVKTYENYDRRMEDVNELVTFSTKFQSIHDFLSEMALLSNIDAEMDRSEAAFDDAIRLSTVHQAKGLEWQAVIIIWVVEGMFPSNRAIETPDGEAEERRLFYVATTRAKDELFICVPSTRRQRDGAMNYCTPSRFIEEIPPDLFRAAN